MKGRPGHFDDRTLPASARYLSMDVALGCADPFDQIRFRDEVSRARSILTGDPLEFSAWESIAELDDELLAMILDVVGPILTEMTDLSHVTFIERDEITIEQDSEPAPHHPLDRCLDAMERTTPRPMAVGRGFGSDSDDLVDRLLRSADEPFDQPSWWPFPLTREEREWKGRRERVIFALRHLTDDEQEHILATSFVEMSDVHGELHDVRSLIDDGAWFRDVHPLLIPMFERRLVDLELIDPIWDLQR